MKFLHVILLIFISSFYINAQIDNVDRSAKGVIFSAAVGTRVPLGIMGTEHAIGYGFNTSLSYTNSDILPVLFFAKMGFEHYAGSQTFLKSSSTYSAISTSLYPVNVGCKYFFTPLFRSSMLFLPFAEGGITYAYASKVYTKRVDNMDHSYYTHNMGATVGVGLSSFLFELFTYYSFIPSNQNIGIDIRVNVPVYARF